MFPLDLRKEHGRLVEDLFFCTSDDLGVFFPVLDPVNKWEVLACFACPPLLATCLRDRIDLRNLVFPARWPRDEGFRVSMLPFLVCVEEKVKDAGDTSRCGSRPAADPDDALCRRVA